jgi:ribosome modulation factor
MKAEHRFGTAMAVSRRVRIREPKELTSRGVAKAKTLNHRSEWVTNPGAHRNQNPNPRTTWLNGIRDLCMICATDRFIQHGKMKWY